MRDDRHLALEAALSSLISTQALFVRQMELAMAALADVLHADVRLASPSGHGTFDHRLRVDRSTLSITWHEQTCFLGNTLLFWFFERIARTPNTYVAYVDLLEDVWGGPRHNATVRGIAKRLRDHLVRHGMPDLAAAIDGSVKGYYGLKVVR